YLAMLNEHDQLLAGANTWGQSGVEPFDDEAEDCQEEFVGETRSKRTLSRSSSPGPKHRKFDESRYTWKLREQIVPTALSANLECTHSMVQNYTADLKNTLWSLQSAGSLPPFPKPEWQYVLSRTAVNLDVMFSGLFSTLPDHKI